PEKSLSLSADAALTSCVVFVCVRLCVRVCECANVSVRVCLYPRAGFCRAEHDRGEFVDQTQHLQHNNHEHITHRHTHTQHTHTLIWRHTSECSSVLLWN